MDAQHEAAAAAAQWLSGPFSMIIALIVALVIGYLAASLAGSSSSRRQAARKAAGATSAPDPGLAAGGSGAASHAQPLSEPVRLDELQLQVARLEQDNRFLEQALALRGSDIEVLTARMAEAAARDREELVRLQDELEGDHRLGQEKARLIRSLEATLARAQQAFHQTRSERERQRASVSALQAALNHAKRAQASTEARLAQLREQLRQKATPPGSAGAGERVVERIIEIPVETIVYRDREVPVEVPIEVPVGFTVLPTPPAAGGLRPRYSENRPTSS